MPTPITHLSVALLCFAVDFHDRFSGIFPSQLVNTSVVWFLFEGGGRSKVRK